MNIKYTENPISFLTQHFGTTTFPYIGATYILPSGEYLDMRGCHHHSEAEKALIDAGLSNNSYLKNGGSPTLRKLNAIRCDTVKYYIDLPNEPITSEQENSLLVWLDLLCKTCRFVSVYADNGNQCVVYRFSDYISDDILMKIRRYYTFGELREDVSVTDRIARGKLFHREPIGEKLNCCELRD